MRGPTAQLLAQVAAPALNIQTLHGGRRIEYTQADGSVHSLVYTGGV